ATGQSAPRTASLRRRARARVQRHGLVVDRHRPQTDELGSPQTSQLAGELPSGQPSSTRRTEMTGIDLASGAGEPGDATVDLADQAEAASIRRFGQLSALWSTVDDAARRAEAYLRLENALHYAVRPATPWAATTSHRAA